MFAPMPRLHTFLLCGTRSTRYRSSFMLRKGTKQYDYERQERCLYVYNKHAPWLRRVMFTVGLEWVKMPNGFWEMIES